MAEEKKDEEEIVDDEKAMAEADEKNEELALVEKAKNIVKKIRDDNNPWGITNRARMAEKIAMTAISTRNGMYAKVPLVCKGEDCPYSDSCQLLPYDMAPRGEFCPIELAQIDLRAEGYARDIDYSEASFTDRNLMSELVTLDIMLERCKALMSKDGTPVIDIAIGVDQEGNEVRQPAVSKAWEAYEKISKKRDQTYQLLMMTRRDRKSKDDDRDGENVSDVLRNVINEVTIDEADVKE